MELADEFQRFSSVESQKMSPFYAYMAAAISNDKDLLEIISGVGDGQPAPNIIFGAVRLLLDNGGSPSLLARYPQSFDDNWSTEAFGEFREFVLDNRAEIESIISSRKVQTNVVRRSAVLLPGLIESSRSFGGEPFVNVEIGASAGLTLLWNQFRYRYRSGAGNIELGSPTFPWAVETETEGNIAEVLNHGFPAVEANIGIEIDRVDLNDQDSVGWLRALIWPEHGDNRGLFDEAAKIAESTPPDVRFGDALELLPVLIGELPEGRPVNAYHSHTLNQFSAESKQKLDDLLSVESISRPVNRLGFEGGTSGNSVLSLTTFRGGEKSSATDLAQCEAHGRWIKWL